MKLLNEAKLTLSGFCACHSIFCFYDEGGYAAQKMTFSIKVFFSKCDQIRSVQRIWSPLLKKSMIENVILCAVLKQYFSASGDEFLLMVNRIQRTFYFLNYSFIIVYRQKEVTALY